MQGIANHESQVDALEVSSVLLASSIQEDVVHDLLSALPRQAIGIVLYGSQARGDSGPYSDIDLLVVENDHGPARSRGRVNLSTYDADQFASARGTLFGMHLARDGLVLHDAGGVRLAMQQFGEIDQPRLWRRIRTLSSLLRLPPAEFQAHLAGFVRHARYVLRTGTYAKAIQEGKPCFSVAELADRFKDVELRVLLSSHPKIQGPPSFEVLAALTSRIEVMTGGIPPIGYQRLADVIVGVLEQEPELADAAILILDRKPDGPYTEIPRVIL